MSKSPHVSYLAWAVLGGVSIPMVAPWVYTQRHDDAPSVKSFPYALECGALRFAHKLLDEINVRKGKVRAFGLASCVRARE